MHEFARFFFVVGWSCATIGGCAPSSQPKPPPDATNVEGTRIAIDAGAKPTESPKADPPPPASASASAPTASASASASPAAVVNVKIVTIGMHVAGGPFDEPTKEPFKKAVEPHFPEIAQCWAKHIMKPPPTGKSADVGVDLLIEATGGHPKISNPRVTPPMKEMKDEAQAFMPCVIAVFESVDFPKLIDRGRTGVSYSLRFTPKN